MTIDTLIWLIPLPPLLAFAAIVLFTNRWKAVSHWIDQVYADGIGTELLGYFYERVRFHGQRYPGILFPCAVGTFSWYSSIGREVSASCDGRFAGDPIAPNFSPNFGMDLNGPTAAVKSYTRMSGLILLRKCHPNLWML